MPPQRHQIPAIVGLGFDFRVSGLGFRVSGFGFRVSGSGFGFRFRDPALSSSFGVSGLEFRGVHLVYFGASFLQCPHHVAYTCGECQESFKSTAAVEEGHYHEQGANFDSRLFSPPTTPPSTSALPGEILVHL